VKTLSDSRAHLVNFTPVHRRVAALRNLTPPESLSSNTPRLLGVERKTMTVRARLVEATIEDDHEIHVVIAVPHHPRKTMIVELPYRRCNGVRTSFKRRAMARARNQVFATCGSIPSSSFVHLRGTARYGTVFTSAFSIEAPVESESIRDVYTVSAFHQPTVDVSLDDMWGSRQST